MAAQADTVHLSELVRPGLARRVLWLLVALAALSGVASLEHTVCPFANFVGLPCPGCGLTRACLALLQLDLSQALTIHPLSVVIGPLLALLSGRAAHTFLLGRTPTWARRLDHWLSGSGLAANAPLFWTALAVALVGVWLARACGTLGGPVPISTYAASVTELR